MKPSPTLAAIAATIAAELVADREREAAHTDRSALTAKAEAARRARVEAKAARMAKETAAEAVERATKTAEQEEAHRIQRAITSTSERLCLCGICRGRCGCRSEITASSDPRWRLWAQVPAAERRTWTEAKRSNLAAWLENEAADARRPVGSVADWGGFRSVSVGRIP